VNDLTTLMLGVAAIVDASYRVSRGDRATEPTG
jgi:hypothetical protein